MDRKPKESPNKLTVPDEKIKILEEIINNNKKLTNTDIEIIYLTVALFMKSKLSKSELLLKIAELTNHVKV